MKRLLISLVAVLLSLSAFAQKITVTGKVMDENGDPLPGAALVAGSDYATSDVDGAYSLKVQAGAAIVVSYMGYEDFSFTAPQGGGKVDVQLKPSKALMLDETVVIGYGTTTKKEVTGSVASLRSDDLDKGAFTDVSGMLQGKVAGLTISNPNGGDPNGSYEILLRGTNTLSAGQGPLIIIDGVVGADISTINFQEVETFDVLKDGSAAAIYGTRGTNGVIIITTKRAKAGKTQVDYDGQVSVQTLLSRAVPMTAGQFKSTIENYKPASSASLYGAETDWFKEVTRTPISHKHNLAIAGGSQNFSHRTVINIEQNQGMLRNNNADKYLFKTNIRQESLNGWLTLDLNMLYAHRVFEGTRSGIFRQAFFHNPTEPVYDETNTRNGGYFTVEGMDYYNPVAMLNERQSQSKVNRIGVNGRVTLNILPIPGLKWENFVSYNNGRFENHDYKTRYYPGETGNKGIAEISGHNWEDLQWESTVQYSKKIGKHSIQALGGYAFQQLGENESYMSNYGFDVDFFKTNNIEAGAALKAGNADMTSYRESSRYIAFFGRAMYNYDEKYLASVSLRYDGSSKFGANNKWGLFPAVSLGWRISQEEFLKDVSWLDDLKLRTGYGVTGNQDFDSYKSLFLVKTSGSFYYNGQWSHAYAPASNANPDLAWEKKAEFNVGTDFSFFKGRLSGSIDYYYRKTTNLLYNYEVPVPPYDYSTYFANVGAISNQGIELTLGGIPVKNETFEWNTSFVAARNINKLISFTNEEFQGQEYRVGWINTPVGAYSQRLIEGESIGTFYGPEYNGLNGGGSVRVKQNRESDWVNLGSAYPLVTLGWSNSVRWGNFSASATFRSSIGGKVFNQMRAVYENITELGQKNILASWLDHTDFVGKVTYSDYYLEDASFLKLDNVSLSYAIPVKKSVYLKGLSVYLTGQNLLTITGYQGVDPEVSLGGLAPGIEPLAYYPRTRVFTLGAKVNF